jgi:hypothetical protein
LPYFVTRAGRPGLAAVGQETRTVPIVFVAVSDPVGQGFVTSLARLPVIGFLGATSGETDSCAYFARP